jgi:hypothetical protein
MNMPRSPPINSLAEALPCTGRLCMHAWVLQVARLLVCSLASLSVRLSIPTRYRRTHALRVVFSFHCLSQACICQASSLPQSANLIQFLNFVCLCIQYWHFRYAECLCVRQIMLASFAPTCQYVPVSLNAQQPGAGGTARRNGGVGHESKLDVAAVHPQFLPSILKKTKHKTWFQFWVGSVTRATEGRRRRCRHSQVDAVLLSVAALATLIAGCDDQPIDI